MTPQRRKVVLLCAADACMGGGGLLFKSHPALWGVWLAMQMTVLVYALVLFARLKKAVR